MIFYTPEFDVFSFGYNEAMVAINLSRLASQLDDLREQYANPDAFLTRLHRFFSFYHQYAHRKHRDAIPESFLRQYDLPKQIVPQLEMTLRTLAQSEPEQSFALIDALWQDDYFEARDLACYILGQQSEEQTQKVMAQVETWLAQAQDRAVVASIFEKACVGILANSPDLFSGLIKKLLNSKELRHQSQGLMALSIYLPKADDKKLPMVYSMVRPFIAQSDLQIQSRLAGLVFELVKRSPGEMAYLLKEVLSETEGPEIEQRLRSYLDYFGAEHAESIQKAIKNHSRR